MNPGGGAITAVHNSTGNYTVNFPNSGIGNGWAVQVAAIGGGVEDYCDVASWFSSNVLVRCFNSAGDFADSPFTVSAVSNTNGQGIAFAYFSDGGSPAAYFSYNPAGTVTINRQSMGIYTVVFNGLNGEGGTVQVTATGSSEQAAICNAENLTTAAFSATVRCETPGGTLVDPGFVISVIPAGATPASVAYAWALQPTTANYAADATYSYNPSGGAVNIVRSGTGSYTMTFAGLQGSLFDGGDVHVTADQVGGWCNVNSWGHPAPIHPTWQ